MTDLVEVGRSKTLADASQQALVLAAVGIECHLMRTDRAVGLYVASTDVEQAVQELACYERENPPSGQQPLPARPARHAIDAALAYCAVLLFFFGAERRHALSVDWAAIGAAQAGLIRDGAWWRTLTALSLHADPLHLMSNLASGVIFGIFVAQLLGSGLAWLTILVAGALGNTLNALLQSPEHTAIGASTAIFDAVGHSLGLHAALPRCAMARRAPPLGAAGWRSHASCVSWLQRRAHGYRGACRGFRDGRRHGLYSRPYCGSPEERPPRAVGLRHAGMRSILPRMAARSAWRWVNGRQSSTLA
jgi:rhomboid protease GluP